MCNMHFIGYVAFYRFVRQYYRDRVTQYVYISDILCAVGANVRYKQMNFYEKGMKFHQENK